jgi:predicted transcriptional regulator of viral defense system
MDIRVNRPSKDRLGKLEQRFLSYAQLQRLTTIRTGELRSALVLTALQEKKVLSRLASAGVIARLRRGVYLFPPRLPVGGVWTPGEYLILQELMKAWGEGTYQLCGWQVFNRYGFTEQMASRVYAYNNRLYGDRTIGGQAFTFIKVADARLGGTTLSQTPEGVDVVLPTKARALMDAVYDWSRFGSLPTAYAWIREAVGAERGLANELAEMASRYGNQGTMRRIGYVLGSLGLRGNWKEVLQETLRESVSLIPLVPGKKARGTIDRNWGVIVNE